MEVGDTEAPRKWWAVGPPKRPHSDNHPDTKIRQVNWPEDMGTVRHLLQNYRKWLSDHSETGDADHPAAHVGLIQIDDEIAGLPGVYGPPRGDVVLGFDAEGLAACGALRELEPGVGEIKRVYVRADHRGPGFGPRLTTALLDRARELGFQRVRVDTLPTMAGAIGFYQAMGFKPIPAYWPHPVPGALFFEYTIASPGSESKGR
jgi:putative acetyltransferase